MASTYEEIIAKSKELYAAGDIEGAKRLAKIAITRRDGAAPTPAMQGLSGDYQAAIKPQKGRMQTLKENVMGDNDATTQNFGEKVGTVLNKAGEAMTFGLVGDEAAAAVEALGGADYATRRDHYRGQESMMRKSNPKTMLAAEIGGAMLAPIPGLGTATTASGAIAKAAIGGGIAGGLYAGAESEGGAKERGVEAAKGAAVGALFGGALQGVLNVGTAGFRRVFKASVEKPTVENLRAAKTLAYKAVEDAGDLFQPAEIQGLVAKVKGVLDDADYVGGMGQKMDIQLARLEKLAERNAPISLSRLDDIRSRLWKVYATAQDEVEILDVIGGIDEMIESRASSSELMNAARIANGRYKKAQLLDLALVKATDQTAGAGSGGNVLNKYRQAVTSIINNPKQAKFFSQTEVAVMREFVRGNAGMNALRRVGKLAPGGNGLMMALNLTAASINPMALGVTAVASGAKAISDGATGKAAAGLIDMVGTGKMPVRPKPFAPNRLGQAAGVYSSSP